MIKRLGTYTLIGTLSSKIPIIHHFFLKFSVSGAIKYSQNYYRSSPKCELGGALTHCICKTINSWYSVRNNHFPCKVYFDYRDNIRDFSSSSPSLPLLSLLFLLHHFLFLLIKVGLHLQYSKGKGDMSYII